MNSNQHRYLTLDRYLKETYQTKVFKVALNGNFTCPNRDGTISTKGCIFCSEEGSGDFAGRRNDPLDVQFRMVSEMIHSKWKDASYIVYFQANTNTYGPEDRLKALYESALSLNPKIVGISIATRCDSISDDILEYLGDLNQRTDVWVELGLQSIHPETQRFLNLGYTTEMLAKAVEKLRKKNITVIPHIINGLPHETKEMMLETVRYLNTLDIQGIKIHSLFILKHTILGDMYEEKPFPILSLEEYADIVSEQLALLRKNIVIHRISGDAPAQNLIEPKWSIKKLVVMNEVDKAMKRKDYYQGIHSEI